MYKEPESEEQQQAVNPNVIELEAVGLVELAKREEIAYMTAYYRAKAGKYVKLKVCANGKSGKKVTKYLPTSELMKLIGVVNGQQ